MRLWMTLTIGFALAATACTSSEGDSSTTAPVTTTAAAEAPTTAASTTAPVTDQITRVEWVSRANAICAEAVEQIDASVTPAIEAYLAFLGDEPYTDQQLMGFYTELLPVADSSSRTFDDMLTELRMLPTSDADSGVFGDHWDELESGWQSAYAVLVTAAADPDVARVQWDLDGGGPFVDLNQRAAELGLTSCEFN